VSQDGRTLVGDDENTLAVLRRADQLARSDWGAAIDLLESVNGAARNDALEIALASLRHRSFAQLASTARAQEPAKPAPSPPIGRSGLPETPLAGLTAGSVRGAVLEHGCLLVRGAVDPYRAHAKATAIDIAFAAQGSETTSAWWSPLVVDDTGSATLGRKWVRGGGGVLLADSPRFMFELLDLYRALGLHAIVSDYLGSRPVLSANKCTLRNVAATSNGDWHQDGAFLGTGIRAINMWLTLTPCGVDAPGLDLVPKRFDTIVETGTGGANFAWAVGPDVVARVATDVGTVRPQFDAGDMLIFDDLFLHRTAVEPEMIRSRHAIEMWCFAADAYPSGQVPLVW
jgi:hypothetical protein